MADAPAKDYIVLDAAAAVKIGAYSK